jgi:hypothetical protein
LPNQAKQRFIALDVGEVSVVDAPANEVEFLVIKRLNPEEPDMSDKQQENAGATGTPVEKSNTAPQTVPVATPVPTGTADVTKAMADITALVESVAKAVGAKPAEEADEELKDAEVEKARKGMGAMRKTFREQAKANGMKGDALKAAMASFDKCASMEMELSKTAPAAKGGATPTAGAGASVTPTTDTTKSALDDLSSAIQKAKMFTPARQEKFNTALAALKAVMDEMTETPQGTSPSTTTPESPTFGASGVEALTKKLEGALGSLTEQVTKGLAEIGQRVETIEKARVPGNALPGDGTDTPAPVKKSMWSGVL